MPPNLKIEAEIFDINNDEPLDDESFLVDTNVWLWLTYVNASTGPVATRQVKEYSDYFQKCLTKHCQLRFCGLTLAELSHQIEKTEREIYMQTNHVKVNTKEFRHNFPIERADIASEVQAAWAQVTALGEFLEITIDQDAIKNAEANYVCNPIDGYDIFLYGIMEKSKISQILTDDGDFATIPGIQVFTSNPNVISSAHKQGKLKKR